MADLPARFSDAAILAARPAKNPVDVRRPYAYLVEAERTASGTVEQVATLLLTNRECPFRCLMCDLWLNTTDQPVPPGAIPDQIDFALARLPRSTQLKLYNSGNFFDAKAIPPADHPAIAARARPFNTLVVENHPRLCGDACLRFRDRLSGTQLEIALGLETVHPAVLPALNKQMTLEDFRRAADFLVGHGISVRAFILLRPPFLGEEEGVEWAVRSLAFAFDCGVECCSVIPTRAGNGTLERLSEQGHFEPPRLRSLERTLEAGLRMQRGRVQVDLWDIERLYKCTRCGPARGNRLRRMNLQQQPLPEILCDCGT